MTGKIAFIGGDLRMLEAAVFAKKYCENVSVYGFDNYKYCYECFEITCENTLSDALSGASTVILPLPSSFDGTNLYAPYSTSNISTESVLSHLTSETLLFGGKLPEKLKKDAEEKNVRYFDYFLREELTLKNALITAEGALSTAMNETVHTINGSSCLVIGYGRIGKFLSSILHNLGANVTCSARNQKDLALIECQGITPIETENIVKNIYNYDIIFNTVPVCVLPAEILSFVRSDTLIVDLASKPGGLDFESARRLGLKVIWATSLPGKTAPKTSGKAITETVFNILKETGKEVKK